MTDSTAPPAPLTRKQPIHSVISWAVRGGVAGLLIWICVWSLQGISALFQTPPAPIVEKPTFNPASALSLASLDSGAWQFLDASSTTSAQTLSLAEAEKSLQELPDSSKLAAVPLNRKSDGLLKLLKSQGKVTRREGFNQYSLDQFGIRFAAFTVADSSDQLVAMRWLVPLGNGQCWLISQTSSGDDAAQAATDGASSTTTLIPSGISHRLLAHRKDGEGETFCQLIVAETTLPDLLDQLRRNSWKFDSPPDHLGSGFVTIYLERQGDSFWMLVTPVADSNSLRLLLLRDDSLPPSSATSSSVEASR